MCGDGVRNSWNRWDFRQGYWSHVYLQESAKLQEGVVRLVYVMSLYTWGMSLYTYMYTYICIYVCVLFNVYVGVCWLVWCGGKNSKYTWVYTIYHILHIMYYISYIIYDILYTMIHVLYMIMYVWRWREKQLKQLKQMRLSTRRERESERQQARERERERDFETMMRCRSYIYKCMRFRIGSLSVI